MSTIEPIRSFFLYSKQKINGTLVCDKHLEEHIKLHVLYELSFFGLLQEVKIRDGDIFWVPVNVNDFTPPFDRISGHMSGQKMRHSNPIGHLPEFLDR